MLHAGRALGLTDAVDRILTPPIARSAISRGKEKTGGLIPFWKWSAGYRRSDMGSRSESEFALVPEHLCMMRDHVVSNPT